MNDLGRAGVYAAVWVPATVLAFAAEGMAIQAVTAMGARFLSWPIDLALNVIPALGVALLLYLPVAFLIHRPLPRRGLRGHLVRGSVLYALIGLIAVLSFLGITGSRSSEFGLVAQALLWPAVVAVGGLLADLFVLGLTRPVSARAA